MSDKQSPRVPMLPVEEAERRAEAAGLNPAFGRLNVFRILLQNEPVAREVGKTLNMLIFDGNVLDGRLRELLIMRIGWMTGAVYEWTSHWRVARGMDIPEADLLAVRHWQDSELFSAADRAILQATDDCLEHGFIQDGTWEEVCKHVETEAERVELVIAIGNWSLFSQLLQSLNVPLEDGVDAWPPDGKAPHGLSA
ncbi:MAG: carboxymuconolactone decarboxylase family protein [Pseudomonadota bacterium]